MYRGTLNVDTHELTRIWNTVNQVEFVPTTIRKKFFLKRRVLDNIIIIPIFSSHNPLYKALSLNYFRHKLKHTNSTLSKPPFYSTHNPIVGIALDAGWNILKFPAHPNLPTIPF